MVGDFTGWIRGAFRRGVAPGVYCVLSGGGGVECVVEPPSCPWHFAAAYMSGHWGGAVELRIYAPEPPRCPAVRWWSCCGGAILHICGRGETPAVRGEVSRQDGGV